MFKNLKLSGKLSISVAISIIAFSVFLTLSYHLINSTTKNSDTNYNSIILSKDLIADILPPPLYIIEAYLICNQMYFENDKSKLEEFRNKIIRLNDDYKVRRNFWDKETLDKKVRRLLLVESYTPTLQFFTIIEKEYIPALGINNRDIATKILVEKIKPLYEQHRIKIDELVEYTNENNAKILTTNKQSILSSVKNAMYILIIIAIILICLIGISLLAVSKSILIQLGADPMVVQEIANKVAEGDLSSDISIKAGDTRSLLHSMDRMSKAVKGMVQEVKSLTKAGVDGRLDIRANASEYEGDYSEVVKGVNATLDAVIGPLNVAAEYIDRISKGDIPPLITDEFQGDFNMIKNNLNQCIKSVQLLVADSNEIFQSAIDGNLNYRADAQQHNGEFRNIISGVNATMDRLVGLIDQMPLGVQIVDKDNVVLFKNKHFSNL